MLFTKGKIQFHIVVGLGYTHELKDDLENNIFVHKNVTRVSKYMEQADLAVTSQGRTFALKKRYPDVTIGYSDHTRMTEDCRVINTAFNLGAVVGWHKPPYVVSPD